MPRERFTKSKRLVKEPGDFEADQESGVPHLPELKTKVAPLNLEMTDFLAYLEKKPSPKNSTVIDHAQLVPAYIQEKENEAVINGPEDNNVTYDDKLEISEEFLEGD